LGGGSSEANDIMDKTGCKPLTLIFARGTSELGNVGTVVGPSLISTLKSSVGSVAAQGVGYAASISVSSHLRFY
jgi:cutinase